MVEGRNAGILDGNDEGTRVGVALAEEISVGVRDQDANNQRAQDVEDENTPDVASSGLGDVAARSLAFTSSVGDDFGGQNVGEAGLDEGIPDCEELARIALANIWVKCTWVLPVAEADTVVVGGSAKEDDNADNDEAEDGDDFDGSEPEFRFTVVFDSNEVENDAYCTDMLG